MQDHNLGDSLSLLVILGAVANYLPPIAALLAIIWTAIRIFEWFRFRVLKTTNEAFK